MTLDPPIVIYKKIFLVEFGTTQRIQI